jgi:ornithine carbamoyltransferase
MTLRHYLHVTDLTAAELQQVLALANAPIASLGRPLAGQGVALIFEKPSNRTRHSSEIAVVQLGGHPVYTRGEEVGIDVREPAEDVARIMSGYHSVLAARVFRHAVLDRMAAVATVPVLNLLSDRSHPLQAVADVLTMHLRLGPLVGRTVAWVGDYNNVARSLAEASVLLGMHVRLGCAPGYDASDAELSRIDSLGSGTIEQSSDPTTAVKDADVVHTDTWTSMGQEHEKAARAEVFGRYQVTPGLMAAAGTDAWFMHCLPAYRGHEVLAEVIDGPRSLVVEQGHHRLDAARAVLAFQLGVRP